VQIHLTARHCELGADVRTFAQQRLEKLSKYDSRIHEVRVIVSQERKLHTAEITLRAHQQDVVITESHADARAAIELAAERLEERVRRGKEKRIRGPRREARGVPGEAGPGGLNGKDDTQPAGMEDGVADDEY
jgi:putative sigma-54 modulation protein